MTLKKFEKKTSDDKNASETPSIHYYYFFQNKVSRAANILKHIFFPSFGKIIHTSTEAQIDSGVIFSPDIL